MTHRFYNVKAFVVASQPSGESSRIFWLFTENLGLVIAEARAVREGKSKLRYHLLTGSLIFASLVRGRQHWRLVGAETEKFVTADKRRAWASILELLRFTFVTDHAEPKIFNELQEAFWLMMARDFDINLIGGFRIVLMFRILYLLGSIDKEPVPSIISLSWADQEHLREINKNDLRRALQGIRHALSVI